MIIDIDYEQSPKPSPLDNAHKCIAPYDEVRRPYTPSFDDEHSFPFPPFSDILRDITGLQKKQVRDAAIKLYRDDTYWIVRDAFDKINLNDLLRRISVNGETEKSLDSLKHSFDITENVSRKGDVIGDVVRLDFTFLSRYKTFDGKKIKMVVPVFLCYRPIISWRSGKPNIILREDGEK